MIEMEKTTRLLRILCVAQGSEGRLINNSPTPYKY